MHKKIILSSVLAMILLLTCVFCGCGDRAADLSGGSMPDGGTTVITSDEKSPDTSYTDDNQPEKPTPSPEAISAFAAVSDPGQTEVLTEPESDPADTEAPETTAPESSGEPQTTADMGTASAPETADAPKKKTLKRIVVVCPPYKTNYVEGDTLNPAGMEVWAIYSNNSIKNISSEVTCSPTEFRFVGDKYVDVEYGGLTTNFPVRVDALKAVSFSPCKYPAKRTYRIGETFDPTGLEMVVKYNNGTQKNLTSGFDWDREPLRLSSKYSYAFFEIYFREYDELTYRLRVDVIAGNPMLGSLAKGQTVQFGSYPQSRVDSDVLTDTLNAAVGGAPTESDSSVWQSCGYWADGKETADVMFCDVTYAGNRYRGIYIRKYRTGFSDLPDPGRQEENGYSENTVYWFRYDPLTWKVLDINVRDNVALLLCSNAVDSQPYNNLSAGDKASNYAESTVRQWLNGTFCRTAFSDSERSEIAAITVNNGRSSTDIAVSNTNPYICENTEDAVFLLSMSEATLGNYGFKHKYYFDPSRVFMPTDYAKAQGLNLIDGMPGGYWLRSPDPFRGNMVNKIHNDGVAVDSHIVSDATMGVVPAIRVRVN